MGCLALAVVVVVGCGGDEPEPLDPYSALHGVVITSNDVLVDGQSIGMRPAELAADPDGRFAERVLAQGAKLPLAYTGKASPEAVLGALRAIQRISPRDVSIHAMVRGQLTRICEMTRPGPLDERATLTMQLTNGKLLRDITHLNDSHGLLAPFDGLERELELLRAGDLAGRDDVELAAMPDARVGDLTHVITALCTAGFTALRAVAATDLPTVDGRLTIGQPNTQGDLDKATIRRHIKRRIDQLIACYDQALERKPRLSGMVQTAFFIAPTGLVLASNGNGVDPALAACVAGVIKQIQFPKPKGGGGVQVNYPFTFRPVAPP